MGVKKSVKKTKNSNNIEPPVFLNDVAKTKWNEIFPILNSQKIITLNDYLALEELCQAYSEMIELRNAMINDSGSVAMYLSGKNSQNAPEYTAYNKSREVYLKLIKEFGMTPKSRKNIDGINQTTEETHPLKEMIK